MNQSTLSFSGFVRFVRFVVDEVRSLSGSLVPCYSWFQECQSFLIHRLMNQSILSLSGFVRFVVDEVRSVSNFVVISGFISFVVSGCPDPSSFVVPCSSWFQKYKEPRPLASEQPGFLAFFRVWKLCQVRGSGPADLRRSWPPGLGLPPECPYPGSGNQR